MLDKQEAWSRAHNSKAEPAKFQCLRLTRKTNVTREDFRRTGGNLTIKCVESAKLLGVQIDQRLSWDAQVQKAVKRGQALLLTCNRLTRPTFRLPPRYMKRLYISVVVPAVEFALPVWYLPPHLPPGRSRKIGSVKHSRDLSKIQRLATILITGAFRTTATDVLDLHADILPIDLRLEQTAYKETLRLCTLTPAHPLYPLVKKCANRQPRHHRSLLHNLIAFFQLKPQTIEKIHPVRPRLPPAWSPLHTYHIAENKEEAIATTLGRRDQLRIYSDGSGYKGHIGASACTVYPTARASEMATTLKFHLGSERCHTVFEGELVGILLALHIADCHPTASSVLIALDNQAAIQALAKRQPQPSHYLLDHIITGIKRLAQKSIPVRVHLEWVPGHCGVAGNEQADQAAKEAASGQRSTAGALPKSLRKKLPASSTALKAHRKAGLREKWRSRWEFSLRFEKMERIDPTLPSRKVHNFLCTLKKPAASIIVQLRTGHVALNAFLKKIKASESALCDHCRAPETAAHFLLYCRKFQTQHRVLYRKIGLQPASLRTLLGEPKNIRHTIQFIQDAGRFPKYNVLRSEGPET